MAGMLLADYGADVVKMERPAGDPARRLPGFAMWNRNKRGLVNDDPGRLDQFLAGADVCITGADQDPDSISRKYPHLVVLYVPPCTPAGAPWAGGAESHGLLSAYGGPARRQSSFDGGPIELVYPLGLYVQATWGAASTVAALIERQRSGCGQVVTVAGIHGVMVCCAGTLNLIPGQQPLPTNVGPGGRHPCYTTYQAQDDQWLFLAALTPKFQINAFKVLGVGDIYADERIQGIPARIVLPENRGWIRQLLADAFRTRPRDEWLDLLEKGDCPAGPLGQRDDWLDHPQILANNLRAEVHDPERGDVVMPGLALNMSETPGSIHSPAPTLGQHHNSVTPWPARERPAGPAPRSDRGPLAGYRVLDLGTILAGPYAGALLAELGADVIKVEPPVGDAFRETGFVYNRGQRGLAIDLYSEAARAAFYRVVQSADAVVDNSRRGVLERLRIDYASLTRVKPEIVTLSLTGFGEKGPVAHKPGFDPVLQAMSGMMSAQGGDCDPVLFTIPVNDIAAATLIVFGVCLGLLHRVRYGVGQKITTSLAACSTVMQSGELVRFADRTPPVIGGRDFAGASALDRFYRVSDGWLRLQARDVASLQSAGLVDASMLLGSDADLACGLERAFASRRLNDALSCLHKADIPASAARMPHELLDDPAISELEMFASLPMQDGSTFCTTNRYARFSRTQECAVFTAPGIGEHSREVLLESGVSSEDVHALIESGAVKQGNPFVVAGIQNYR